MDKFQVCLDAVPWTNSRKASKVKVYLCLTLIGIVVSLGIYHVFSKAMGRHRPEVATSSPPLTPAGCQTVQECSMLKQKSRITKMLKTGLMNLTSNLKDPLTRLMPTEKTSLNLKDMVDPLDAGNETTSTLKILGPRKEYYRQGDDVTVMVTVRDGRGLPTRHGGDQVRVWLVGRRQEASLAPEVVDLVNGSYVAVIPLLWSGDVTIKASLAYNLLVQRAHYHVRNVARSVRYLGAGFTTYFKDEITLCSPYSSLGGYNKMCNFTVENGGMPWFCGMPKTKTLTCRHWTLNFDFDFISPLPGTAAERSWWGWIKNAGRRQGKLSAPGIDFTVVSNDAKVGRSKIPCHMVPFRQSWISTAPRGHFMTREWVPRTCSLENLIPTRVNKCVTNTTILVMGDSNARLMFHDLASATKCVFHSGHGRQKWHYPLVCSDISKNLTIRWRSHALPFHMGSRDAADRTNQKSVNQLIDEIPSSGRYWAIIHLYIHFTAHNDEIFITHMKSIRHSVERLLRRNPETTVIIRGPHVFRPIPAQSSLSSVTPWVTPMAGDLAAPFYTGYIKKAFRGLEDRVYFLQPWDMTVATENVNIHPPKYVTRSIVNVLLGHVCG